jgi:DNA polymerase-4
MDAFYASVEIRDNPRLKGKPVIIGGPPNSRAVVCTASYEARKFGIHSAMPCAHAARLCPDAIFIRPDFEKYYAASREIRDIFAKYTDMIEPLSLDEAYLDVTDNKAGLYAVRIASLIQKEIFASIHLTGSAGVAPNKLLAKIASDMRKPFGITVVLPEQAQEFMRNLPLRKIHGIGPATEQRLASFGLRLCQDVWPFDLPALTEKIGTMADWLYLRSRGLDEREVEESRVRKSLGREETFSKDIIDVPILLRELLAIVDSVSTDLKAEELSGRTISLKVRYDDFSRITRSSTLSVPTNSAEMIDQTVSQLLKSTAAGERKIRLLGVSVSNFAGQG